MDSVDVRYFVPRGNFDAVVAMLMRLKNARDLVNAYYLEKDICCSIGGDEFAAGMDISVEFHAYDGGKDYLWESLYLYFSSAGVPSYVANYSDYDVCEKALAPLGKTLRRRIIGGLFGKTVVDV